MSKQSDFNFNDLRVFQRKIKSTFNKKQPDLLKISYLSIILYSNFSKKTGRNYFNEYFSYFQREAKIKEVEYWLKQSLTSPSNGLQRSHKSNKGPTLQLSNLKSSGSALSLSGPQVNKRKPAQRTVVGKMPLKGTMPRPQSLVTPASTDIMYTDPDHLEATMRLQQEIVLQQVKVFF